MKYVWISVLALIVVLRLFVLYMRHQERQVQQVYREYQQREKERAQKYDRTSRRHGDNLAIWNLSKQAYYKGLVDRGYLQYCEPADTSAIHEAFLSTSHYTESDYTLPTLYTDENKLPLDRRYYPCHGGMVYMKGGFIKLIDQLRPTFEKIDFKCEASNQQRVWSPEHKWVNETILINGKTYTTLKDFTGLGYKEAPARYAEIINEELQRQHKTERIYLISSDKKGQLAILTPELYQYIDARSQNNFHSPLAVAEWRELHAL